MSNSLFRPLRRAPLAALLIAAVSSAQIFVPRLASAEGEKIDKKACVEAYEKTQTLRKQGKLIAARESSLSCAQSACPAAVRDDCTSWSVDLEKSTPSVVFGVRDAEGHDVSDVTVFVDGVEVTAHLDGKAIPLDPGSHKVRFVVAAATQGVVAGATPGKDKDVTLEQVVLAREGERNRAVTVHLPAAGDASSSAVPPADADATSADKDKEKDKDNGATTSGSRPTPSATYVLAGIGVVGLVGFAAFGLSGLSSKKSLDERGCKPDCPQDDVDSIKSKLAFADVSLAIAVVSFGIATIVYVTRSEESVSPTHGVVSRLVVGAAPVSHGGAAFLRFSF